MWIWIALIVAPLLALTDQSISFAMVGWSCAHQTMFAMHAVHLLFLALTAIVTIAVWRRWRDSVSGTLRSPASAQIHFLSGVATATAALSTLTIVAMWGAAWVLSSCVS